MKDKLRELAAGWTALIPNHPEGSDIAWMLNHNAAELLAILDADRDCLAAPYGHEFYDASGIYHFIREALPGYAQTKIVPLYDRSHPARSGVVSDEDVNKACAGYFGSDEWYEHTDNAEMWIISMRAALEHFAKRERHER